MKKKQMKSKVVVVTGASAGLGRSIVHIFAEQGAHIALLARNEERLEATKREVERYGVKAITLPVDVASNDQIASAAALIEQQLGPIDIWINNAMVSVFSPVKEMTPEEYKRVTDVTYLGYVYGTLSALKYMLPRNQGMIIQVGSALAYRSIPLQSAYCAAKHAVKGFTESVRTELLHDRSNVKITMIQLPAMNTPQFNWVKSRLPRKPQPVPPIYQPEVAAEAILWAATHYRKEWYLGFLTIIAVIGNKITPGIGDWYLARQGYEAQQYNGPDDPNRPNNLFESPNGDYNAHGDFDERAFNSCWQFWITKYRTYLFALFVLLFLIWIIVNFE